MLIFNSSPVNGAAAGDCDGYITRAAPYQEQGECRVVVGRSYIVFHTSVEYWSVFKVISECCPSVVTTTLNYQRYQINEISINYQGYLSYLHYIHISYF